MDLHDTDDDFGARTVSRPRGVREMTFDEWWQENKTRSGAAIHMICAQQAWLHQQARIKELENEITCMTKADIVRVPTKDAQQRRIKELEREVAEYKELAKRLVTDTTSKWALDRLIIKERIAELETRQDELLQALIIGGRECAEIEFGADHEQIKILAHGTWAGWREKARAALLQEQG